MTEQTDQGRPKGSLSIATTVRCYTVFNILFLYNFHVQINLIKVYRGALIF